MTLNKTQVEDSMSGKPKAFEEIEHSHKSEQPTRLEKVRCERCHYDIAEQSFIDIAKNTDSKIKTKVFDNKGVLINTATLKKIVAVRGRFDDCIGWNWIWQ